MPDELPPTDEPLASVFSSRTFSANIEAEVIQSLLESAGIACWVVRENVLQQPVGNVTIKVLASQASEAEAVIRDAASETPADEE